MQFLQKSILFCFLSLVYLTASAQLPAGMNIDQLTDQQIMQFVQSNGLNGMSESELEAKAKERGLSADQIQKLKARIQSMNPQAGASPQGEKKEDTRKPINNIQPKAQPDFINGLIIFGSDIFTKENLSFEPNLTIPTPRNYILGAGDELKIDIYGFSDKSQSLRVSPDGNIRYPNIGPIKMAGLSIEEAKAKLTAVLGKIYPGLQSGNTSLQLSLGQIRSIKVNLIGEITRPGTYTVSSLSTIANALYAAGGPTKLGSYRHIELVRGGKSVAQFDLYEYLLNGNLLQNKLLQDDDVIRVAAYSSRVEVRGAVKRKAIYELGNSDRLGTVLTYAGGLADEANKEWVRVVRFGNQEKEIYTVKANEASSFLLQTGDQIYIDNVANSFKNRVSIKGAIYYEGEYELDKTPTLKDLLLLAKPKEIAFKERAIIRRLKPDYTPAIIGFNVNDILMGKANIVLQREDSVHLFAYTEIKEKFTVQVNGEVNAPQQYGYADGMQVQDAILLAGGYREGASKKMVEVARRIRDTASAAASPVYATILQVDLSQAGNSSALQFQLEPYDIVSVRKAPGYKEQVRVSIEGEVVYPGSYAIVSNQEKLSDLLKRAGGIKEGGYATGAFLLRKTFENLSPNDTVILKNKLATLKATFSDTMKARAADSTMRDDLKIVGIRLNEVLDNPGSVYDVILQEGDIIKVPKKVETVQTFSGVYFPKKIVYRDGLSIRQVIRESGGVIPGGQRKKAYIVYPNGEVRTTQRFFFVSKYPRVKPGSEIYVPVKQAGRGMSTGEILGITTGLATLATMVITISNLTK